MDEIKQKLFSWVIITFGIYLEISCWCETLLQLHLKRPLASNLQLYMKLFLPPESLKLSDIHRRVSCCPVSLTLFCRFGVNVKFTNSVLDRKREMKSWQFFFAIQQHTKNTWLHIKNRKTNTEAEKSSVFFLIYRNI